MQTEEKKNKLLSELPFYLFLGSLVIGLLGLIVYLLYGMFS